MSDVPAIGIDVGGGSTKIGIVAPDGRILARGRLTHDPGLTGEDLLRRWVEDAFRLMSELRIGKSVGIGIGLPGQIDHARGTTQVCNLTRLNGLPITDLVRDMSGLSCVIENDATMAALAEHRFGVGRGAARFMAVTLGTGIGVGFLVNGRPVHSSKGTMGDIGHVIVDPAGTRRCRQGCRGCLESVASGVALADSYRRLHGLAASSDDDDSADLAALFIAARSGDTASRAILDDAARQVGAAIVSWTHIFAPDRIALAGGVIEAFPSWLVPIESAVRHLAMADYLDELALHPANMGNDAGFVGAAALAFSHYEG